MARTYPDAPRAGTRMKGSHVRVLRDYIQSDLNDARIPFTNDDWGWNQWDEEHDDEQRILALYFTKMRQAIQLLWEFKGRGDLPPWTDEAPRGPSSGATTSSRIRASHITDLRRWLNMYKDNHSRSGVSSFSYNPRTSALIDSAWAGNVASISQRFPRPFDEIYSHLFQSCHP